MAAKNINKEKLIQCVEKHPCIYDNTRPDYKYEEMRENAWKEVCEEVLDRLHENPNKLAEDITLLKRTFKNLRDRFTKMHKEYRQSGSVDGIPMEPSWPYFKYLHFLVPFMKRRHGNSHTDYGDSSKYSFISFVNTPKSSDVMVLHENNVQTQLSPQVPSSALNQTIVPAKKLKLTKKQGEIKNEVLMETEMETNNKSSQHVEADADDLFGQSIGKQLKKFNEYQKSLAKLKIQQVLHEVLLETAPPSSC